MFLCFRVYILQKARLTYEPKTQSTSLLSVDRTGLLGVAAGETTPNRPLPCSYYMAVFLTAMLLKYCDFFAFVIECRKLRIGRVAPLGLPSIASVAYMYVCCGASHCEACFLNPCFVKPSSPHVSTSMHFLRLFLNMVYPWGKFVRRVICLV